ncbi:sporulation domain-containing protein [Candidatus Nitrosoglobus terrae]|uniref:Sporulation domain-containing protein n=1 Tax=Candidatus Nitrosoglobus terrae TaxID=1630141 RepID=A0A1Q2SJT2_9GAMM|nr:SPOR domain-containing protein [Candidatus Nitrosoglobus terrae]BAW79381.1 sporulation domain-containing protein [Candidatus Nitrosoglobus terrae]
MLSNEEKKITSHDEELKPWPWPIIGLLAGILVFSLRSWDPWIDKNIATQGTIKDENTRTKKSNLAHFEFYTLLPKMDVATLSPPTSPQRQLKPQSKIVIESSLKPKPSRSKMMDVAAIESPLPPQQQVKVQPKIATDPSLKPKPSRSKMMDVAAIESPLPPQQQVKVQPKIATDPSLKPKPSRSKMMDVAAIESPLPPQQQVKIQSKIWVESPSESKTSRSKSITSDIYVLQAGSFRNYTQADKRKATLALLGIEATIQTAATDNNIWHRVRIGPNINLAKLYQIQHHLHDNQIECQLVKIRS